MEAIVDYDYVAQESDELTLHKGDVLRDITILPGGWWEGTLDDKRGMFPDNFVRVLEKDGDVVIRSKHKGKRQCRAVFSYTAAHEDELTLNVGDVIDILGEVEEGWWRGHLNDREGVFPSNFVQEINIDAPSSAHRQKKMSSKEDLTNIAGDIDQNIIVPSLPPKPAKIMCQVQYPYEACNDDELTLKIGDIITLISKDGQDKGWWRGELRGRTGVFPDNFVHVITISADSSKLNADKKPDRPPPSKIGPVQLPGIKKEFVNRPISNVAVQRKSLEIKTDTPPVPGKKPVVPIKKSPSLTGSTGGIFSGLKQKVMGIDHKVLDSTDGICSSKPPTVPKDEQIVQKEEQNDKRNEFDQVERSGLLIDPRATRAKAPGRRPPSMVLREMDSGLTNGSADHPISITPIPDENETDNKPKQRGWEKNRAPWMDELKLNQAKKTSPLNPSPESTSRLKFTSPSEQSRLKLSNEKLDSLDDVSSESSKSKPDSEMTKSMSAISSRIRTPTPDLPDAVKSGVSFRTRNSLNQPITSAPISIRPQSIHGDTKMSGGDFNKTPSGSIIRNQSPSPLSKPPMGEKHSPAVIDRKNDTAAVVSYQQYSELEEKIKQLEAVMERQQQSLIEKIEEMSRKLQSEIETRQQLQIQVDKLEQCVTQV